VYTLAWLYTSRGGRVLWSRGSSSFTCDLRVNRRRWSLYLLFAVDQYTSVLIRYLSTRQLYHSLRVQDGILYFLLAATRHRD